MRGWKLYSGGPRYFPARHQCQASRLVSISTDAGLSGVTCSVMLGFGLRKYHQCPCRVDGILAINFPGRVVSRNSRMYQRKKSCSMVWIGLPNVPNVILEDYCVVLMLLFCHMLTTELGPCPSVLSAKPQDVSDQGPIRPLREQYLGTRPSLKVWGPFLLKRDTFQKVQLTRSFQRSNNLLPRLRNILLHKRTIQLLNLLSNRTSLPITNRPPIDLNNMDL